MGRVSDPGADPMPPREAWKDYAVRVLDMLGEDEEERQMNLEKVMEALNESLIVARNIHRKTSHMEAARDFYKFALEMNSSSNSKKKSHLPDKKNLKSPPSTSSEPKLSSPTKQLKRDGRGRFISTSSPDSYPNKTNNAENHHTISPTTFLAAHDDYCKVCEYGGELICCATCNLVFHLECLRPKLMKLPPDNWSCPYCVSSGSLGHKRGSIVRGKAMAGVRVMDSENFKESCRRMKAPIAARVIAAAAAAATSSSVELEQRKPNGTVEGNSVTSQEHSPTITDTLPPVAADSTSSATTAVAVDNGSKEEGRCRRIRHPATRYDPQFGPASKWQSDEVVHWPTTSIKVSDAICTVETDQSSSKVVVIDVKENKKSFKPKIYYEDEEHCGFCQGASTIPICCFCSCRLCFRKKDKDIIQCAYCKGKYHKACLRPPDFITQDEEWRCSDCTELASYTKASRKTGGDSSTSTSSSLPHREDEESRECSPIQGYDRDATDYGEECNETITEDQHSDNSSLFENQLSEYAAQDQPSSSLEPLMLKRKRGRPPKLKKESNIYNNNSEHGHTLHSSLYQYEDGRDAEMSNKKRKTLLKTYVKEESETEFPQSENGKPFKSLGNSQENSGSVTSVGNNQFLLKKRGRGRPKKSKQRWENPFVSLNEGNTDVGDTEGQIPNIKRKRGRPPKFSSLEGSTHLNASGNALEKRKRGRPPKSRNTDAELDSLSPVKKRGRPFKQNQQQHVFFQQPAVTQGSRNEHQWLKNAQHRSVDSSIDGDSQPSGFGEKKNSDHNYSDIISAATGEPGRLGPKADALFYEDRLIGEHDTNSQVSTATTGKSSSSSLNKDYVRNSAVNGAALCASAISRSGRPLKPNSLLFEPKECEQHLRSSRYALEQQLKKTSGSSFHDVQRFFNEGKTSTSNSQLSEGHSQLIPDSTSKLEAGPSNVTLGVFPPGRNAFAGAGASTLASGPSIESANNVHDVKQLRVGKQPVQIYVDMGMQHQSTFDDLSQPPHTIASLKQPRRKPGARECMQISRRFHTQVIPARYMEVLLDYVNRGKIEHLVRMRERLDEHSRLLESQLAGLEALVRVKGEYNETEAVLAP